MFAGVDVKIRRFHVVWISFNYVKHEREEVTDFVMNEREPQVRLDNGVRHQQVLNFLHFLLAPLAGGEVLTSHREVPEKLQRADCRTYKHNRTG